MDYKELEERLNFITHYIGTGMAIAGCVALIVHAVRTGRVDYIVGSGIFYLLDFYKKGGKIMDTESSGMQLKKQNSFITDIFSICNIFSHELLATYRSGSFVITQ